MPSDFILTLDSDGEDDTSSKDAGLTLDPGFVFDLGGGMLDDLGEEQDVVKSGSKPVPISVDDIIARRKGKLHSGANGKKRKRDSEMEEESDSEDSEAEMSEIDGEDEVNSDEDEEDEDGPDSDEEEDPLASSDADEESEKADGSHDESNSSDSDSEEETQAQKDRKAAFFGPSPSAPSSETASFSTLNLSRPLLRALTQLSFHTPTPIQASTIPVALEGHDVLGSAVTGSGKTAAFMIPCLERLMYREKGGTGEIRVLILVPTRELAVQCADVSKALARFMDVSFGVIVGGLSVKAQEITLRGRPDIVIATPGRLIDHLRNTPSFSLSSLDILILDEADRMLSDGFAAELAEIIQACPKSRQTMLFSATMTDDVDSLVRLSLNRPVRLFVDPKKSLARGLVQEFVRIRKESDREGVLAVLCAKTARRGAIVFFRSKKLCHQMRVVFGLLGMRAGELHGDLSQEQRLNALRQFRDHEVDYLLATDLASRGLDIKGIETVINYDMPGQIELYLHRVGRTARAGEKGRSISLVGEPDRRMLKAAIKRSEADKVRHRLVPSEAINAMVEKLDGLKDDVVEVLKEEKEEKAIRHAEMELKKGENMIEHEKEIFARPKRTWFTSEKEKTKAGDISKEQYQAGFIQSKDDLTKTTTKPSAPKRDKFAGLSRKAKRRKLAMEDDEEIGGKGAIVASIREAKRAAKPPKITEDWKKTNGRDKKKRKDSKVGGGAASKSKSKGKSFFDNEMGAKSREGVRSKKGDHVSLNAGKKGKMGKAGKRR